MSRTIEVKVVDKAGYGLKGYKVKIFGGPVEYTDRNGRAIVGTDFPNIAIYVNGTAEYSGSTGRCPSPLVVRR
jgi:hypothetical protein